MHQFFVRPEQVAESPVQMTGGEYNHIRNVLRLRIGDRVVIQDGTGKEYLSVISEFDENKQAVLLDIIDIRAGAGELPAGITLFQGYPKGDKMETIVQKAVELGASEIVPVMMKRSVVKLDSKRAQKKVERLQAIADSAAKQSKRGRIPQVTEVMAWQEAVAHAAELDYLLLPYEQAEGMEAARQVLKRAKGKERIGVFIGPEGGFDASEVEQLCGIGAQVMTLGHRILRTETAGMTVLSLLMFLLDE